jgi:hypothetical protein
MPVIIGAIIGLIFGTGAGFVIGSSNDIKTYKKCRYYDQTIERCVAELGWEKK